LKHVSAFLLLSFKYLRRNYLFGTYLTTKLDLIRLDSSS